MIVDSEKYADAAFDKYRYKLTDLQISATGAAQLPLAGHGREAVR